MRTLAPPQIRVKGQSEMNESGSISGLAGLYRDLRRIRTFKDRAGELLMRGQSAGFMLYLSIGVPMVLPTQGGTGRSGAAQHSRSLQAWVMHMPGLRLTMPTPVTCPIGNTRLQPCEC